MREVVGKDVNEWVNELEARNCTPRGCDFPAQLRHVRCSTLLSKWIFAGFWVSRWIRCLERKNWENLLGKLRHDRVFVQSPIFRGCEVDFFEFFFAVRKISCKKLRKLVDNRANLLLTCQAADLIIQLITKLTSSYINHGLAVTLSRTFMARQPALSPKYHVSRSFWLINGSKTWWAQTC